jgi:hypothetical protein
VTIVVLGWRLGYAPLALVALSLAGIGAALGVRNAAGNDRFAVVGVVPLWLAALAFTGLTGLLVSDSGSAFGALAVAGAALLGPFGIVGNTVRSYGEGTGRTLLGRYLVGTLVLAGLVILYAALLAGVFTGALDAFGVGVGEGVGALLPSDLGGRVILAFVLYPTLLYLSYRASDRFPAAVFVPFREFDRVESVRARVDRAYSLGRWLLVGLAAVTAIGYAARFSASGTDDSSAGAVETLGDAALGIVGVATARPLLGLGLFALLLALSVLVGIYVVREYGTASATALTQTVGPPLSFVVGVIVFTVLFGGFLPLETLEAVAGALLVSGSPVHQLLVEYPSLLVLTLSTAAILASAVVFSVPTALAAGPAIDESLAGLAAGVLALVVVVLAAVVAGEPAVVIVLGVAVVAVVWELGEYATVAAGELRTASTDSSLPAGFATLSSIHAAASGGVAVVGAVVAVTLATVAGAASLPSGFALLAVIASVLGLAGLVVLLTG